MKIVTLNPPYFPMFSRGSRSPAVTKSSTLYYPILLAYATGVLENDGFDVTLIDAPAAGLDSKATLEKIKLLKPDLVVCETSTPSIENDMQVVRELKDMGVPFVVAVGTHVSAVPEEVLSEYPFLDVIARHEYEYTIRELARQLKKDKINPSLNEVKGISFRQDGIIKHNQDRPYIENLDELPFVSCVYERHLRGHMNAYFYGANMHPIVSILSGRGCPNRCSFCVYPQTMTGHRYRLRSANNLVDELESIKRQLPEIKEIFIEDDTFTANRKRAQEVSQEIMRRNLNITWSTNSRADLDLETMRMMHKAGCRLFCVGFESASQQILDKLGKDIKKEKYLKFMKNAKTAGILIHGCFIYGNEGETLETMRETLALAKQLNCDTAQFYPIMVYPGTRAYDVYMGKGYIKKKRYRDWLTKEGLHNCVVSLPNISSTELVEFCNLSRREFYLRFNYIIQKVIQVFTKPREGKRILRAFNTLIKHLFTAHKKR